jgi:hypothetical protein
MNIEDLVRSYIQLRDKKLTAEKAHKKRLAKLVEVMDEIEHLLQAHFNDTGVDSVKTKFGTAFRTVHSSVRIDDPLVFRAFVENTRAWEMLDARANKTAVDSWLEEHGDLPPGVSINRVAAVNIRRA